MATYPVFVVNFTTHKDGDVVASADPNTIQAEVAALETTLGAMPHVSTANGSAGTYANSAHTYANVAGRLANIEQGIVSDAHTQYVHIAGGDTIAPAAGTVGLTVKAPATPSTNIFQVVNNTGTPVFYVDAALVARLASGAAIVDASSAQTLTNKTLTTPVIAQIVNTGTLTLPSSSDTLVGRNTTDTLTNKTLTTPTIGSFANAGHDHSNAAGGTSLLQVNTHGSADTNVATTSLHHTIGTSATQAAAGNHGHVTANISDISGASVAFATTAGNGGVTSVATRTGAITLDLPDVGSLANIVNTVTNTPGISGGGAIANRNGAAGNAVSFDWVASPPAASGGTTKFATYIGGTIVNWIQGNTQISSGSKTFVIDHPTDKGKYLVHAAVEGPETAAFYRGRSRLSDGHRVVQLPAYFAALCDERTATVHVTPVADVHRCEHDDNNAECYPSVESCNGHTEVANLVASPVKDGQFIVGRASGFTGGAADQTKFSWLVIAERKDVPSLAVEPSKADYVLHGDGPYTYLTKK